MNRSLLLIICDFLLLSFLALASFDIIVPDESAQVVAEEPIPVATIQEDIADLMRQSLEAEAEEREQLEAELERARQTMREREAALRAEVEARDARLRETEEQLAARDESLTLTEAQLRERQEELARIEERRREAEERQRRLETDLSRRTEEITLAQERLRSTEEALRRREETLSRSEEERRALEEQRLELERERLALAGRLEVAETERRLLTDNLERARVEVESERRERETVRREAEQLREQTARLATDVTTLADASTEIREEVRGMQAITASSIFQDFQRNHVEIRFNGVYRGVFANRDREFSTRGVIVEADGRYFVVFHSRDTPFAPRVNPTGALELRGELRSPSGAASPFRFSIREVGFLADDPRLLWFPIGEESMRNTGLKTWSIARDPFRFNEAVLVDQNQTFFGEANFQVSTQEENKVEFQRQILSRLFGEIRPAPGNIVFSQRGEFMGIVLDNRQALLVNEFRAADRLRLGDEFSAENLDSITLRHGSRLR